MLGSAEKKESTTAIVLPTFTSDYMFGKQIGTEIKD